MNRRQWQSQVPRPKKNFLFIGTVGLILVAIYPTLIHPMLFPNVYRNIQAEGRKDIIQEEVQPGNMKVWSDPFGRK